MSNIKDNLTVKLENKDSLNCSVSIEFPRSVYDEEYNKVLNYVAKTTSVPGFRKGKVPATILKQRYANYITDQLASDLRTNALEEAIKQENLKVASITELSDLSVDDDKVSFTANFELHPKLELTDYKGLKLTLVDLNAKIDDELEEWLKNYTKEKAKYEDIDDDDRAPKRGEWAKIDILSYSIEGLTEKPTDQRDIYFYLPNEEENYYTDTIVNNKIVELLLSMKKGDTKEFSVSYPVDYKEEFFRSKTVSGTVYYKNLAKKVEPELTDDLVKEDKTVMFDTVEALKNYFTETIKSIRAKQQEEELVEQVKTQLLDKNVFDIPKSQIDTEKEHLKQHWGRLSDDELEKKAVENIKFRYIVSEIIAKEELSAKPEDLQARMPKDTTNMKKEDLQRLLSNIENTILWNNFISFIKENADITYYDPMKKNTTDTTKRTEATL